MEVHIGSRKAEVELISKDGNHVQICIDGKEFDLDIVFAENGVCSIISEGKSYNAELLKGEGGKRYTVNVNFSSFNLDLLDIREKYIRNRKRISDIGQQNQIVTPMPGKIVKVYVKSGDKVFAGTPLLIIEAMKMQSIYKADHDCVVQDVLVNEGDTVASAQTLIILS